MFPSIYLGMCFLFEKIRTIVTSNLFINKISKTVLSLIIFYHSFCSKNYSSLYDKLYIYTRYKRDTNQIPISQYTASLKRCH